MRGGSVKERTKGEIPPKVGERKEACKTSFKKRDIGKERIVLTCYKKERVRLAPMSGGKN